MCVSTGSNYFLSMPWYWNWQVVLLWQFRKQSICCRRKTTIQSLFKIHIILMYKNKPFNAHWSVCNPFNSSTTKMHSPWIRKFHKKSTWFFSCNAPHFIGNSVFVLLWLSLAFNGFLPFSSHFKSLNGRVVLGKPAELANSADARLYLARTPSIWWESGAVEL